MTSLAPPLHVYLSKNRVLKVADLFCGAGGFSKGAMKLVASRGRSADLVCVNHWDKAIATHALNLPQATHFIEDINEAKPRECVPGGYLDLLLASPSCTYHSNARGGRPVHDQGRMDPFAIVNWLRELDVRCLVVENVPEFRNWGPLCTLEVGHEGVCGTGDFLEAEAGSCGRPDPHRQKEHFNAWVAAIRELGYAVQWHLLNAADFGDATTRTRFFLQARKDGQPIVWPEASHGDAKARALFPHRKPWRAAREIIDWKTPGKSVFDDPKYKAKPLAYNTRRRMVRGLQRLGNPFWERYAELLGVDLEKSGLQSRPKGTPETVIVMGKQSAPVYRTPDEPVPTVTTQGSPQLVEAIPFVLGQQSGAEGRSVDEPSPTIAAAGAISLVLPYYHTGVAASVDDPLATVTSKARFGLVQATIVQIDQQGSGEGAVRDVDEPLKTIVGKQNAALVQPSALVMNNAPHSGEAAATRSADEPVYTITTNPRLILVEPDAFILNKHNNDSTRDVSGPLFSVTTDSAPSLVESQAFLVPQFGERPGQDLRSLSIDDPTPAVTSHGAGALVEAVILTTDQTGSNGLQARGVDEPAFAILTTPNQAFAKPALFAVNHGGADDRLADVEQPLGAVTTKRSFALAEPIARRLTSGELDWRRLVIIDGQLAVLDLFFRMLHNRELARAMGFDDEESVYEFVGNAGEVTKQIGNAVPVHLAMALVEAALFLLPRAVR
jgi:DNA (cytosine-5)-methyltransferase 1